MTDACRKHVLVLERQAELRAILENALEGRRVSIESAPTPESCLRRLSSRSCDLLIVDGNGDAPAYLEWLRALNRRYPPVPTLVVVQRGDIATAVQAVKAGALDCLERPIESTRLRSSVEAMLGSSGRGDPPMPPLLTPIEIQVLRHIATGRTNREIADMLRRSIRTIEVHRGNLTRKLGTVGLVNLVRRAAALGLIDLAEPITGSSPTP